MHLSHAARKYALIMSIRLLAATDPDHAWQADKDAVSDVIMSTSECGPVLHVGGEILQLTHEDRNNGCAVHFATVCALRTERCTVLGYVPREWSRKCSLSSVALRVPGASPQSVVVSR